MLSRKKIDVGTELETMCIKCKGPSIHVIQSIKNGKIDKIMCKSCLSTHKYKSPGVSAKMPKTLTKKRTVATASNAKIKSERAKKASKTRAERQWSRLLAAADENNAISYSMAETYTENDVINHETFGVGVVVKIHEENKISVAFQDGVKILVQNR